MTEARSRSLILPTRALPGIGAAFASIPFFRSFSIPKHKQAPFIDIEFPKLKEGQMTQSVLLGLPIFVARRTQDQIEALTHLNEKLRDPESLESEQPEHSKNIYRSQEPEIFVAVGLCTHLGCSPANISAEQANEYLPEGGFFCPCHGAVYDAAGRVYKGMPAPKNMRVPNHKFIEESVVRVWLK